MLVLKTMGQSLWQKLNEIGSFCRVPRVHDLSISCSEVCSGNSSYDSWSPLVPINGIQTSWNPPLIGLHLECAYIRTHQKVFTYACPAAFRRQLLIFLPEVFFTSGRSLRNPGTIRLPKPRTNLLKASPLCIAASAFNHSILTNAVLPAFHAH